MNRAYSHCRHCNGLTESTEPVDIVTDLLGKAVEIVQKPAGCKFDVILFRGIVRGSYIGAAIVDGSGRAPQFLLEKMTGLDDNGMGFDGWFELKPGEIMHIPIDGLIIRLMKDPPA